MKGSFDTRKASRVRQGRFCSERSKARIEVVSAYLLVGLCTELGGHKALLGFESVPLDHIEDVASGSCQARKIPL